jgi:hypothetical protein
MKYLRTKEHLLKEKKSKDWPLTDGLKELTHKNKVSHKYDLD